MMVHKNKSATTLAAMQITAGGTVGLMEVSLMHPLDVIKTRFQLQQGTSGPEVYTSIRHCVKTMYTKEGPLSFYKGILPPILAETPKRATKFFTFEQYKQLFLFGASSPTFLTFLCAGFFSGLTEACFINPFEVVKVTLQANRREFLIQPSTFEVAKNIMREQGFGRSGLYRGITATLCTYSISNMVYFGFYHNMKAIVPKFQDSNLDILRRFLIGFASGSLAAVINIPFDVAKSRIQGPQGNTKYTACFATIATIYKEEGFFALYRGLLPKIMRLGPGGAIMLLVFEDLYSRLVEMEYY